MLVSVLNLRDIGNAPAVLAARDNRTQDRFHFVLEVTMSSVVLSIVNLAAGAVFNSVCDRFANSLKYGDCTDEKCRQLIVRELDEIKTRLDGLARKDLLSSVSFLKDGLCLLSYTIQGTTSRSEVYKSENNLNYVKECLELDENDGSPWRQSDEELHSHIAIFDKALNCEPGTLDVTSKERFISAKTSFENAYTKATEAFNNEALSTTERILAAKLRIVSKILQCLEDPDMAIAFCELYLQQLHELPAVRKRFAVFFFRRRMKSRLSKKKRADNIRCVVELNYALYQYVKLFAKTNLEILARWPKITLRAKEFNPLLVDKKILKRILKCGLCPPNQFQCKEINNSECIAVNGDGKIVAKNESGKSLEMFSNDGELVGAFRFHLKDRETDHFEILALAVGLDDSVYAVTRRETENKFHYKLYMLDSNLACVQQQVSLGFLTGPGRAYHIVCIAVDANKNIFVTKQDDAVVFSLDHNGKAKKSFTVQGWNLIKDLQISAKGEVVASELVGKTVGIYAEDGEQKQEITLPSLHKVCGLAFDYADNAIIVLAEVLTGSFHEYRLLSYSECGKLEKTLILPRQKKTAGYRITSHPKGPLAVLHETGVIYLHH